MSNVYRVCPACHRQVGLNELETLTIKRKQPPVKIMICSQCCETTRNVLKILAPHFPEKVFFFDEK